jgi:hypothetical protein
VAAFLKRTVWPFPPVISQREKYGIATIPYAIKDKKKSLTGRDEVREA